MMCWKEARLLLAQLAVWRLVEVWRHSGSDQEGDLLVQDRHCERLATDLVTLVDEVKRTLQEDKRT